MNKTLLLEWLLNQTESRKNSFSLFPTLDFQFWDKFEAINRYSKKPAQKLPRQPDGMIPLLRELYRDRVTPISMILNHYFPEQFLYYRVSQLEEEIFGGFQYFSDVVPEFKLDFNRIGPQGYKNYEKLNQKLLAFARRQWPRQNEYQSRIEALLYQGLGGLFREKDSYRRCWVITSKEDNFDVLKDDGNVWSGCKEMQAGDLVFVYRMSPVKAITDIFRLTKDAEFDPWYSWHGFKASITRVCSITPIPFSVMRQDPVLKEWGTIRKQFQGTTADPIPHRVYNRLLDLLPESERQECGLEPEPITPFSTSGEFTSEREFEDAIIQPLIQRLSWRFERQKLCRFQVGSQMHPCRVDFFISDERGPLTLFENKLRIRRDTDKELEPAREQGRSYALMLGLPSFIVAAPEGIWIYALKGHNAEAVCFMPPDQISARNEDLKEIVFRLRR